MKKLFVILLLLVATQVSAAQWDKSYPIGTTLIPDLATDSSGTPNPNNEALDRLLANYREGLKISYSSSSALAVSSGEITVSNAAETVRLFLKQASAGSITFSNIDTGSEASSTTYYVYAGTSTTSDTTPIFYISTSSTSPSGVTYYKKIGSFYNNSSSNITNIKNNNDSIEIATGTILGGNTLSLPSGWSDDECDWTVSLGETKQYDDIGGSSCNGNPDHNKCSVNSSRVVSCSVVDDGNGGNCFTGTNLTANYIIVCHR